MITSDFAHRIISKNISKNMYSITEEFMHKHNLLAVLTTKHLQKKFFWKYAQIRYGAMKNCVKWKLSPIIETLLGK